ncbi:serine hydrolase domain-containing protein [Tenacibaculum jejuense]|uniref:Putative Penicillin-binding protein 4*, family S12 n=1 Tax=Tenacibaculum jejuense TaxID=584609 RepID=A0A238U6H1_9FLAO|nr:serine hydrolase domain-containing protein [Tenacibaculum jejuense]SNR14799.1 putative Penicillin-binding protein 4*, family S12 [Tenacibaculum jejuense]
MKKSIFFLVGFLCVFFTWSQSENLAEIDKLFTDLALENKAIGTISIFKNGNEVFNKSTGFISVEDKLEANAYSNYRIASITKTYTATIILQLISEKKLTLNTKLSAFFPKVPNSENIRIQDMLYHRSGLFNVTEIKDFSTWIADYRTREEMLEKIQGTTSVFNPDSKASYSNTNFILLSYVAEEIEKKPYAKIFEERIADALDLDHTYLGKDIAVKDNGAKSYYFENDKWNPVELITNINGPIGAGGIVSTATEVNIFFDRLFSGKLLFDNFLKQMTTPKEGLGMGLSIFQYRGMNLYGHNGSIDGFRSIAGYIPSKKVGFTITCNGVNKISLSNLIFKVLDLYFKNDPSMQSNSLVKLKAEDLEPFLGVYGGETFPFKITFTKEKNTLMAQATGQPIFNLIALKKNVFKYDAMGILFNFNKKDNTVLVKFQGKEHVLKKEKV